MRVAAIWANHYGRYFHKHVSFYINGPLPVFQFYMSFKDGFGKYGIRIEITTGWIGFDFSILQKFGLSENKYTFGGYNPYKSWGD